MSRSWSDKEKQLSVVDIPDIVDIFVVISVDIMVVSTFFRPVPVDFTFHEMKVTEETGSPDTKSDDFILGDINVNFVNFLFWNETQFWKIMKDEFDASSFEVTPTTFVVSMTIAILNPIVIFHREIPTICAKGISGTIGVKFWIFIGFSSELFDFIF